MSEALTPLLVTDLTNTMPITPMPDPFATIPTMPAGPYHLYVVVLFAYHKTELRADCIVVPSVACDDAGSLQGAAPHNRVVHPENEWTGHQEYATQIPDDLIRSVLPHLALPQATPDPFALTAPAPLHAPVATPIPQVNPSLVPSFPSPYEAPKTPQPQYLVVAMHANNVGFRV